jgi:hypothetical protein
VKNLLLRIALLLILLPLSFCGKPWLLAQAPAVPAKLQSLYSGTTIVAFRTPDNIYVAADSRITSTSNPQEFRSYCKIRQVGNTFFAFAGIAEFYPTGFNLADLTASACRSRGTVFEKARQLERLVKPPLEKIMRFLDGGNQQKRTIPTSYDIGVVLCAVENGVPVMAVRKFIPTFSRSRFDSIYVDKVDCPGPSVAANGTFLAMLGHRELVKRHLGDKSLFVKGIVPGIRRLVQYEIDANPLAVGPPIDILSIGKTSFQWIGRKPECFQEDE